MSPFTQNELFCTRYAFARGVRGTILARSITDVLEAGSGAAAWQVFKSISTPHNYALEQSTRPTNDKTSFRFPIPFAIALQHPTAGCAKALLFTSDMILNDPMIPQVISSK